MDTLRRHLPVITGIRHRSVTLGEPILQTAARMADRPGTVLLKSGGTADSARYDILAGAPLVSLTSHRGRLQCRIGERDLSFRADPFEAVRVMMRHFKTALPDIPGPVSAGLFGYLAYDLKDHLERLPRTCVDALGLPQLCLYVPGFVLVHDRRSRVTDLYLMEGEGAVVDEAGVTSLLTPVPMETPSFQGDPRGFCANFSPEAYKASVSAVRDYIAAGHVYQVNLSQRFEMDFSGSPFGLFTALYRKNPAPFFAYIHAGDHCIVSTSPERFLLQQGRTVETRPIKGTRPRGKTPAEDEALRRELADSPKDDAELSMIVDLLRNDIGKVCRSGSVHVSAHKRVEAYDNVFHLVSDVRGELEPDCDAVDLLKATFPGGSITGCPKIRAMEIIDELEPHRRHFYTGAIGYIGFHDTMDLSIAIRTAVIHQDRIYVSTGGGIVFDSDPEAEYQETLHKGRTFFDAFPSSSEALPAGARVWCNGRLLPPEKAAIPVVDLGLQYGYGFFETLRVVQGRALRLDDHIRRFYQTWETLFPGPTPDLTWPEVIDQVVAANELTGRVAAVKIMATYGDRDAPPFNPGLVATARPYTHPLDRKGTEGLAAVIYQEARQTPLAAHKTLNYLYYYLAGRQAAARQASQALILNVDGSVSETHCANLLLIQGKRVVRPASAAALPGVMEQAVCRFLEEQGYAVETRTIFPDALFSFDQVLATNALMGAVPLTSLEGRRLGVPDGLCRRINQILLA